MADWYLAPSLSILRAQVNKRWPNRSKSSDGTIGDPAHASRVSSHNPNSRGSVNAIDITNEGIDVDALVKAAVAHPSTWYVISRGYIYSSTYNFRKRVYTGSNPHNTHVHISIHNTVKAENSTVLWFKISQSSFPLPAGEYYGVSNTGNSHNGTRNVTDSKNVAIIQRRLRIKPTGRYGLYTRLRVLAFQKWKRLKGTGNVGRLTWDTMFPPS